jgi:hypothetical protein
MNRVTNLNVLSCIFCGTQDSGYSLLGLWLGVVIYCVCNSVRYWWRRMARAAAAAADSATPAAVDYAEARPTEGAVR